MVPKVHEVGCCCPRQGFIRRNGLPVVPRNPEPLYLSPWHQVDMCTGLVLVLLTQRLVLFLKGHRWADMKGCGDR